MAAPPQALLPTNTAEFHGYAFSNACLRVYTIVSLRDKVRKDDASQTEASRGLHWEMVRERSFFFNHWYAEDITGGII